MGKKGLKIILFMGFLLFVVLLVLLMFLIFEDSFQEQQSFEYAVLLPACDQCQYLEGDKCINYRCCSDADCNISGSLTENVCEYPKTTRSFCKEVSIKEEPVIEQIISCKDMNCFEERFKKCLPVTVTSKIHDNLIYYHEIIGLQRGKCKVDSILLANPDPNRVGKKMTCLYNSKPFNVAFQDISDCSGELYKLITHKKSCTDTCQIRGEKICIDSGCKDCQLSTSGCLKWNDMLSCPVNIDCTKGNRESQEILNEPSQQSCGNENEVSVNCCEGLIPSRGICVKDNADLIHDLPPNFSVNKIYATPENDLPISNGKSGCFLDSPPSSCYRCWSKGTVGKSCFDKSTCDQECSKIISKQCIVDEDCVDEKAETFDYCENNSCINKPINCYNLLIQGSEEDKLDIVFVAEGFETNDDFKILEEKIPLHISALLKREPFFSEYQKLNFHLVSGSFDFGYKTMNSNKLSLNLVKKVADKCFPKAEEIIGLVNKEGGRDIYLSGGKHKAISSIFNPEYATIHEFGHSFGGLADEYVETWPNGEPGVRYCENKYPNIDSIAGCPKWCSGTPTNSQDECTVISDETECRTRNRKLLNGKWEATGHASKSCVWLSQLHPFFGSRCVKIYDDVNHGTKCLEGTGCYHGANDAQICWRSAPNSIMNSGRSFSPVAVKHIKELLTTYK